MLEIGSLVDGKYKILSKIGQGGMSVVYMAINEKANKTWAVKEVRKDGVLDFEAVKQGLVAETDILKKLNHAYLPSIVDVIDTADSFIIIMDYIQGNDLQKALDEYGAQPQDKVIKWAKQLCDVLGYLHTRQPAIIYRDMKPKNVMLRPDGNIALIDFGTAREFKARNVADTTCLGTVGYAAPEQFGGMGQTDARTDIYCLGATLYHLVTGCNPSEPPYEMRPIREINPGLSAGLEKIILKCTQRNPDDRFQTDAELMYALEHYDELDGIYRKKQKGKLGWFIASAVLTVLLALGGLAMSLAVSGQASSEYEKYLKEAEREADDSAKLEIYENCISLPGMSGKKEAYTALIEVYKNDGSFTEDEEKQLKKLIMNNTEALQADEEVYRDVCFEAGILYWYYYSYGGNNPVTRAQSAAPWFEDALEFAPENYENYDMAAAYSSIGNFYKEIAKWRNEGKDKNQGIYKSMFDSFKTLMEGMGQGDDVLKLKLLEFTSSSINQYVTNLKLDGVSEKELTDMCGTISTMLESVNVISDDDMAKKESIESNVASALEEIATAYATEKGEGKN